MVKEFKWKKLDELEPLKDYSKLIFDEIFEFGTPCDELHLKCEYGHPMLIYRNSKNEWVHCNDKVVDFNKPIYCECCVRRKINIMNYLLMLEKYEEA